MVGSADKLSHHGETGKNMGMSNRDLKKSIICCDHYSHNDTVTYVATLTDSYAVPYRSMEKK